MRFPIAQGALACLRSLRSNRPAKTLFNDPNHYTIELENDRVRVVRIRRGPVRSR